MRAVLIDEFGGPEKVSVGVLPIPEPGAGEVRIRVAAAAVNPTDRLLRSGVLASSVSQLPRPLVPGMDASGLVDAVGAGVALTPGTAVIAFVNPFSATGGAQAEYVVVPADQVAAIPGTIDLVDAAGMPLNGLTADLALRMLDLPRGASIGVTGGAGALGSYAIQLARHRGLRVIAEARDADRELLRSFGADVVVPRDPDLAANYRAAAPGGVDAVIDAAVVGRPMLSAVRDGGRLVKVRPYELPAERGILIDRVYVLSHPDMSGALAELVTLAEQGVVTLRTARRLAADEVGAAQERLEAGGVRGRQLIVFRGQRKVERIGELSARHCAAPAKVVLRRRTCTIWLRWATHGRVDSAK